MRNFDYIYDPPDAPEPSEQSNRILALLEESTASRLTILGIMQAVAEIEALAARDCPVCEKKAAEEEARIDTKRALRPIIVADGECLHGCLRASCITCQWIAEVLA